MSIKLFKYDTVKSTNDTAKYLIEKEQILKGLIYSEKQTNGKGRYGNKWLSLKGNLFLSIFFPIKNYFNLKLIQTKTLNLIKKKLYLEGIKRKKIKIKYPNDILVDEKKISGVLIETIKNNKKLYAIIGIGMNLISSPKINKYSTTHIKFFTKKKYFIDDFVLFFKKKINHLSL